MDGPTLIADALVVTCDAQDAAGRMSILVRDGQIAEFAPTAEALLPLAPEADIIDARQMLVIPGFVNAHFHPESLLFQDPAPRTAGILWKPEKNFRRWASQHDDPELHDGLLAAGALAAVRHLRAGVTTVSRSLPPLDAHRLLPLLEADRSHGLQTVTAMSTWQQIAEAARLAEPRQHIAVSVGTEEELTVYHFDSFARAARDQSAPLVAAIGEFKEEADLLRRKFRKGLLAILRDFQILDPSLHLVHLNYGTPEDVQLAARHGVTITLTPRSAAAKRTGYPLLRHLGAQPVQLCLGTDWGETDMLREMQFTGSLPLLFPGIPAFSPLELLRMATINGARALSLDRETGSIERGKRADLIFFGLKPADFQYFDENPAADALASVLLRSCASPDIVRVMVEGATLYANGSFTRLDEAAIVAQFRRLYGSLAPTFPGVLPADEKAKIIPFVPPASPETEDAEEIPGAAEPGPAPAAAPPQPRGPGKGVSPTARSREPRKPELSKNVRKVFGEDDDPAQE